MRQNTHNELALKKELAPRDYRRSETVRIIKPKSGLDLVIPTCIYEEAKKRGLI